MKLTKFDSIGGISVYRDELGAVLYKSGCTVNADGAVHAYAPDNSGLTALDYLANAGSPGNWWGIACDDAGKPYIQAPYHDAPGFYVSTTALCNPKYTAFHPRRFVDSERYCFSVIPGGENWFALGSVGLAWNEQTGDKILAMFNPEEYSLNKDNNYASQAIPGLTSPLLQFVHGNLQTLDMELFFDTFDAQDDVRTRTSQVFNLLAINSDRQASPQINSRRFPFRRRRPLMSAAATSI